MNDIMDNFRENVRNLRQQKRMTQDQLAVQIGVSGQMVRLYETSRRMPSIERLVKIADAFDVSLDELIGRNRQSVANSKLVDLLNDAGYDVTNRNDELRVTTPQPSLSIDADGNPKSLFRSHVFAANFPADELRNHIVELLKLAAEPYTEMMLRKYIADAKRDNVDVRTFKIPADIARLTADRKIELSLFEPAPNDPAVADAPPDEQNPEPPDEQRDDRAAARPDAQPDDQHDENSARK